MAPLKSSKFTDGALIPRPSMVRIAIVSSVLAVIVVGGIVVFRPFDDHQPATKVGDQKSSAQASCYDIMANVEWMDGLKLRSGSVTDNVGTRLGAFQFLSCSGYEGEGDFAFAATVHPGAFDDLVARLDRSTLTPIPYEGTDLLATRSDSLEWSDGRNGVVSLRSDRGYEIRITDCCDVRPLTPAELNDLANAINVYLNKNF